MDNNQLQYIKIQSQYADEVEQFEKCVVKAAKLTRLRKNASRRGWQWNLAT